MIKIISNNKKNNRKLINVNLSSRLNEEDVDKIIIRGKKFINFSSNDYLGLSKNKTLIKTSRNWTEKFGTSLSSSRLISGNLDKISLIEKNLSKMTNNEQTLIVGSGYLLNSTLIPSLTENNLGSKKKFAIFTDKLNHSSLNHGCYLTRQKIFRYRHTDLNHLESVIRKACKFTPKIIISETLFSMDGDKVDVSGLRFLAKRYHAILYLDEAHAAGVYGKQGFGLSSSGKKYEREVVVGTFGKSFGSYGAFVSSSKEISQKIINTCGGLIYSTALPPSILGSIYQAVKLMPKLDYLRKKLLKNSEYLLNELKKNSFNTGRSNSQIIPIIMRCPKKCLKLTNFLRKSGFFTKLIKPPTVPVGSERIRLSLTATMDREIIKKLVSLISSVNFHET